MRAPPEKPTSPTPPAGGRGAQSKIGAVAGAYGNRQDDKDILSRAQAYIAIRKSPSAEIRASLKTWHGEQRLELREFTAAIPGVFMSTAGGFSLTIDKIPELVTALQTLAKGGCNER